MAEDKEPSKDIKNDKNSKPKFNSNWIFVILILSAFADQIFFTG